MGVLKKANVLIINLFVGILIFAVSILDKGVEPFRFIHYFIIGFSSIPIYISGRKVEIAWATKHYDALIVNIEKKIFKTLLSIFLLRKIKSAIVGEILGFSYFSFFLQFLILGLPFYFFGEPNLLPECFFTVFVSLTAGILLSTFFPVYGPRFFLCEEIKKNGVFLEKNTPITPGYFFTRISQKIIMNFGQKGGAMPSLHSATNIIFSMFLFRFSFEIAIIWLFITLLLGIGAIYHQYHYLSDIIAGYLWGIIFFVISPFLYEILLF